MSAEFPLKGQCIKEVKVTWKENGKSTAELTLYLCQRNFASPEKGFPLLWQDCL
jgi:hypothetical protein